jgi:hypothetical protein
VPLFAGASSSVAHAAAGAQFTCFTSTKVHILTSEALGRSSGSSLRERRARWWRRGGCHALGGGGGLPGRAAACGRGERGGSVGGVT